MNSTLSTWVLLGWCAVVQTTAQQDKTAPNRTESDKSAGKPIAAAGEARPTYMLYRFGLIPIQESMLSATKPGAIIELPVTEGAAVEKGDVLGQIDGRESQASIRHASAEISVARKQAESDAPVQAAIATKEVAETEYKKAQFINETRPGTINDIELKRLRLTMDKAEFQIAVAQQEFDVAQLNIAVKEAQLEVAQLDAELRKIRAPYAGEVVEMKHHVGEWVQAGDTVLHLVQMDRLRVTGYLDLVGTKSESKPKAASEPPANADSLNNPNEISQPPIDPTELLGRDCEVLVHLPKGRTEPFKSKVAFISPVQNVNNKIRVWIEIENKKINGRWLAQPGQMATVKVLIDTPSKPKVEPKGPPGKPAGGVLGSAEIPNK